MPHVILEDETLRDGLQPEPTIISTTEKAELFYGLLEAGLKRVQLGSFVHPKYVPQMADADQLVKMLSSEQNAVLLTGLILNRRGLERAQACGLKHLSMSVSASNEHSLRNVKKTASDALNEMTTLIKEAHVAQITVRAGLQCAFGCVYQGKIEEKTILTSLLGLAKAGATELNLADTTGMANPKAVFELVTKVRQELPDHRISLHLHDTRGLGLANMYEGYMAGVRIFDVALGGLGGCPFVKGAAGNIPTEDAVNLFEQMGINTGINLDILCNMVQRLKSLLGRDLPGRMCHVLKTLNGCRK
ncbi:hydroxymethylglutaryl-CoA lyase [Dethiosulfatarculus sandiegensis]|uniref:Pyruvate carboxyltransferase domain-containing protein n=1 Tax=Dethiosulfatarculus sandiegensis TaxID=1429043 RepID=A0A0D2HRB5_9BACT|nr:hydroxymethylglutaryl-CoA lyase [Dethiosulfatarculus sandiegensis]KIX13078.1 hypothetical protein X474_16060 [Dethiosulfatarculus sandiegensis]